jgi:hypothetical protein
MEVEQSEDYTCIIAHGSHPKTTRIFGDCILEPCPLLVPDWESKETEEAELYWLVKGPGDADEEFMRVCFSCNRNLDGDESCIYRYVDAFAQIMFQHCSEKTDDLLMYIQILAMIIVLQVQLLKESESPALG